jgi:hypothetical protein
MAKAEMAPMMTGAGRWRAARVMQTNWLLSPISASAISKNVAPAEDSHDPSWAANKSFK